MLFLVLSGDGRHLLYFATAADDFAGVAIAFDVGVANPQANALAGRIGVDFAKHKRYDETLPVSYFARQRLSDDLYIVADCLYAEYSRGVSVVEYADEDNGRVAVGDDAVGAQRGLYTR